MEEHVGERRKQNYAKISVIDALHTIEGYPKFSSDNRVAAKNNKEVWLKYEIIITT